MSTCSKPGCDKPGIIRHHGVPLCWDHSTDKSDEDLRKKDKGESKSEQKED
jgi:hypothetical protein